MFKGIMSEHLEEEITENKEAFTNDVKDEVSINILDKLVTDYICCPLLESYSLIKLKSLEELSKIAIITLKDRTKENRSTSSYSKKSNEINKEKIEIKFRN